MIQNFKDIDRALATNYHFSLSNWIADARRWSDDPDTQDFYEYSVVYDKDNVVDLSSIISNANPSYYNYSTIFYEKGNESFSSNYDYYIDNGTLGNGDLIEQRYILNKQINDLLRRNDADELKDVFELAWSPLLSNNLKETKIDNPTAIINATIESLFLFHITITSTRLFF